MTDDPKGSTESKPVAEAPEPSDTSGSFWLKHDEDLRYVRRVLESEATPEDRRAAIDIIHKLRTMVRAEYAQAKPVAEEPQALLMIGYTHAYDLTLPFAYASLGPKNAERCVPVYVKESDALAASSGDAT